MSEMLVTGTAKVLTDKQHEILADFLNDKIQKIKTFFTICLLSKHKPFNSVNLIMQAIL